MPSYQDSYSDPKVEVWDWDPAWDDESSWLYSEATDTYPMELGETQPTTKRPREKNSDPSASSSKRETAAASGKAKTKATKQTAGKEEAVEEKPGKKKKKTEKEEAGKEEAVEEKPGKKKKTEKEEAGKEEAGKKKKKEKDDAGKEEAGKEEAGKKRKKEKDDAGKKAEKEEAGKEKTEKKKKTAKTEEGEQDNKNDAKAESAAKRPRAKSENKPRKASKGAANQEERLDPAPTLHKDQKSEIVQFLRLAKDFTDENAKEELRKLVPDFKGLWYDSKLNIYWVRKGMKGVGVGVSSRSEGKDFAYFGFLTVCDNWIFAIAAAIKAAEIMVAYTHICTASYPNQKI